MNERKITATILILSALGSLMASSKESSAQDVDRSASFRFVWVGAPAAFDPPFGKNQFQTTAYSFPIYDSLVRLDSKGNIVPDLATSWEFSANGLTLTMHLRQGVKFTDGSDMNAAAIVRSLTRSKTDPGSLVKRDLGSFDSFEAKDSSTVVLHLNTPDANVLFTLATSAGMIVSAKALDDGVDLSTKPIGTGPYKLVSSGPQGAIYERNEDYFDKSQNQFAKVNLGPIVDVTARLNALRTGQADAGFFQADQWAEIQALVATGKFKLHSVLEPNSLPVWLNTKIKPLDNPKVRMALNLAIDREAINKGIQSGQCQPASQPLPPGVVGHDDRLVPYKQDLAKAKQLLQEAGVGPFTINTLVSVQEPLASVGVAVKAQLQAIGVTLNIVPTGSSAIRPEFRAGAYGAMIQTLSVPAPDPASIIDAVYMSGDNPGGVTTEFAKAIKDARIEKIGSAGQEAAYKAISRMAYDDPQHVFICWSTILIVHRKNVVGIEKTAYINAVPIPDIRTYGLLKSKP